VNAFFFSIFSLAELSNLSGMKSSGFEKYFGFLFFKYSATKTPEPFGIRIPSEI
jgi:hypothetical protein